MPSRPPALKQRPRAKAWASTRKSRQARGYGREHERIRSALLSNEPLCRPCRKAGRVTAATIADHIVPLSEGGTSDPSNYQPICVPCHDAKTAREAKRSRRRPRT